MPWLIPLERGEQAHHERSGKESSRVMGQSSPLSMVVSLASSMGGGYYLPRTFGSQVSTPVSTNSNLDTMEVDL